MEQEKKRWRHIGKGTTLHLKIAGLFRDVEDVHKVGRVRGVGDPSRLRICSRQLRPAVIARKISCGNKTPKGARTWQILASLKISRARSCRTPTASGRKSFWRLPGNRRCLSRSPSEGMSILISDFDGTVTQYDFFDLVRKRWPFLPEDDPWVNMSQIGLPHFEVLAEIFARIRTGEADLLELADSMELDASFARSARELQDHGWENRDCFRQMRLVYPIFA
jgi:hypothetical protein